MSNDSGGLRASRSWVISVLACFSTLVVSVCTNVAPCVAAGAQLTFELGVNGLASLSYDRQQLLADAWSGTIRPVAYTPKLKTAAGVVVAPQETPRTVVSTRDRSIQQHYSWGIVECTYVQDGNRLRFDVRVTNASAGNAIQALDLELVELAFATVPQGRVLEAGMWGLGGNWRPLHEMPLIAQQHEMPPAVFVQFESGTIAFTNDGDPTGADVATVSIPFTSTPASKLTYPFRISFPPIAAGRGVKAQASLRFGAPDATAQQLAGDVLQRFRDAYPFVLDWRDRRPIGALFLATSQKHPEKNPRGWFSNAADVDVTTTEGHMAWRTRLLNYADVSIKVLKDINAQGMITWDPEGQEFEHAVFYGDPRLASQLSPETNFVGTGTLRALDEYFQKFRDAGLKTGVTLRPQAIAFKDGVPFQAIIDNPTQELLDKIDYARKRWGCTLFYIDSTYDKVGALSAEVFKTIANRHADVLLLPENESFRYFAYTAPLNSYHHHGVLTTPASVREVYRQAFSALMVTTTEDKMQAGHAALVDAVRRGDILIVNAWYGGTHIEFVKSIYRDAAR